MNLFGRNVKMYAAFAACMICASVYAENVKKTGMVSGLAYSPADKKITVTILFGTEKKPEKQDKKADGQFPQFPEPEDMITLNGDKQEYVLDADDIVRSVHHEMREPVLLVKDLHVSDIVTVVSDGDRTAIEFDMMPGRGMIGGRSPDDRMGPPPMGCGMPQDRDGGDDSDRQ